MTITSYEISKQLYEAGFRGKSNTMIQDKIFGEKYYAYDLETLLEALPKPISIGLDGILIRINTQIEPLFCVFRTDESVADTAARLLLQSIKTKQI